MEKSSQGGYMHISGIVQIVFSPTGGTQKVADMITDAWNLPIRRIDISQLVLSDMRTAADELCVIAVPSFGGRVPEIACRRIRQLSAQGSPAVLVAVYGNRAFEDTLVELEDTVKEAGFVPIAGIAAVVIRAGVYAAISGGGVSAHPFLIGRTVSRRIDPVIGMDLSVALIGTAVCTPSGFIHWFPIRIFSVVVHKATPHISLTAIRLL